MAGNAGVSVHVKLRAGLARECAQMHTVASEKMMQRQFARRNVSSDEKWLTVKFGPLYGVYSGPFIRNVSKLHYDVLKVSLIALQNALKFRRAASDTE
jgi:hypothetical protein